MLLRAQRGEQKRRFAQTALDEFQLCVKVQAEDLTSRLLDNLAWVIAKQWFALEAEQRPSEPTSNNSNKRRKTEDRDCDDCASDFANDCRHGQTATDRPADGSGASKKQVFHRVHQEVLLMLRVVRNFLAKAEMPSLFFPVVVYAERYASSVGPIDPSCTRELFFTATLAALKFWFDSKRVDNATFARSLELDLATLTANEKRFLAAVDFDLVLKSPEAEVWRRYLAMCGESVLMA